MGSISHLQGMSDEALTSECLELDILETCLTNAGWRSPTSVSTMPFEDIRNTIVVRAQVSTTPGLAVRVQCEALGPQLSQDLFDAVRAGRAPQSHRVTNR